MRLVSQIVSVLLSIVCIGQSIKAGATKFDKITFTIFSLIFLIFCIILMGVK